MLGCISGGARTMDILDFTQAELDCSVLKKLPPRGYATSHIFAGRMAMFRYPICGTHIETLAVDAC